MSVIKGPVVSGGDEVGGLTSSPAKTAGAAKKIIKTALRNPFPLMAAIVMDIDVPGLKNIYAVRSLGERGLGSAASNPPPPLAFSLSGR